MTRPPVFLVLAEVRFNPILTMAQSVEAIQERWRGSFPDFSEETVSNLNVNFGNGSDRPEVKNTTSPLWLFKNLEGTSGFFLTTSSLVFQTTHYKNSETFIGELVAGLREVHACTSLAYVDGLGFRILDAIIPDVGRDLEFYLNPKLMGLYQQLDGEFLQSISQLTQKSVFGRLTTRTVLLNSKIGLPADLVPIRLKFDDRIQDLEGIHAVLDNDISQRDRFQFDLVEIERRLRILKEGLNDAFYSSVSPNAIESWK